MRKFLGVLAAAFIAMGVAGAAHAATLDFSGSLSLRIATLNPIPVPGSGSATVNGAGVAGHLTSLGIPAGPFAVEKFVLPVTDPSVFPIAGVQVTAQNAEGNFVGNGGAGFAGPMVINGQSKVCLFGSCSAALQNLSVPLSVVGNGNPAEQVAFVTGAVNLTVVGAPWTTGTALIGDLQAGGFSQMGGVAPASNTGAEGGHVTLVTPLFISTNIGASAVVPAFGIFDISFAPEPGAIAAIGAAFLTLVAVGVSRRR